MANLKHIQSQIKSVSSIQKVTKAMKMVAAAKLKRAQERMEQARPYSKRLETVIQDLLASDLDSSISPLLQERQNIHKHAILVITSDRGLAGSFNSNIIKAVEEQVNVLGKDKVKLICIGKKCFEYFENRSYNVESPFQETWDNLTYTQAINIGNYLVKLFLNKEIDSLNVVFNFVL